MAKTKNRIFLCCFGPPPHTASPNNKRTDPIIKKRTRKKRSWISWLIIRIRNTSCKTVPLEDHYSNPKPKPPKSTLRHNNKPQAPPPPSSTLPLPPQPATPYYTPSQTRHGASKKRAEEGTRQQLTESLNDEAKQEPAETTTKQKKSNKYEPMVGMSIIVVTLVIMVFWGRLCAILCTSAWLYYIPHFKTVTTAASHSIPHFKTVTTAASHSQHDISHVDVDLDSEDYKKKVIMEGLLDRKRGSLLTNNKQTNII